MTDPGAIGTLIIGLESVRMSDLDHQPRPRRSAPAQTRPARRPLRLTVVSILRGLADRLDRPTVRQAPG